MIPLSRAEKLSLATIAICLTLGPGASLATENRKFDEQLLKLDPTTRLEQTCDAEVLARINKDQKGFRVDKVIAYAFGDTEMGGDSLTAPGAVMRSRGDWYRLSYKCVTGPRHLDAQELSYQIGAKVPREDWEQYSLYN